MFFKKNGQTTINNALEIFSRATTELQHGINLLDTEKEEQESILIKEETKIIEKQDDFNKAQARRESDFKNSQTKSEEKCKLLEVKTKEICKEIDSSRKQAEKVIKNINLLLK